VIFQDVLSSEIEFLFEIIIGAIWNG